MTPRTVLITGGAKRLGATIARTLAAAGHRVVIHYNSAGDEAAVLAAELGGVALKADLADSDAVTGLIERARSTVGGPITGLVNSVSAFVFDRPPVIEPDQMARLLAINLSAPVLLANALAAQADVADGAIVNLIDQKVANLNPDFFSYSCAKIALAGATAMLAQALASCIRVNAVSPGLTLPSGDQSAEEFAVASCKNLLRRPVGAERVAEAVAYLIAARGVTGQNIFVDCGQRFLPRDGDVMFEGGPLAEYTTILDRLDVMMRLGIHAHEQVPQRVRLSVRITVDYPAPLATDAIDAVVDYDFVRAGILALADGPGFALQETLCEAVAALCFRDARVRMVTVQSMKLDIYPDARVGCEVVRRR